MAYAISQRLHHRDVRVVADSASSVSLVLKGRLRLSGDLRFGRHLLVERTEGCTWDVHFVTDGALLQWQVSAWADGALLLVIAIARRFRRVPALCELRRRHKAHRLDQTTSIRPFAKQHFYP